MAYRSKIFPGLDPHSSRLLACWRNIALLSFVSCPNRTHTVCGTIILEASRVIEHILQRFREWNHLGTKLADDGSLLIAHTPRDYPQAYLHSFFAPVPESAWQTYGLSLPGQLQQLYRECNGISIFAGSISLYGIRAHYERDLSAQFQPFDLATHHSECIHSFRGSSSTDCDDAIFFGSYVEDGSHVFTTPYAPQVHRVLSRSFRVVNTWADLATFLATEYDRIDRLFSRTGYLTVKDTPTTPQKI